MDASAVTHNHGHSDAWMAIWSSRPVRMTVGAMTLVVLGIIGMLGCSGDTTDPVSAPLSQAYWALQLNWRAVNLALTPTIDQHGSDTVDLQATALNALGSPLPGAYTVRYYSADSTVHIDSLTGHVTAKYLTSGAPTMVYASLTVGNVTRVDTAKIQVTQNPLPGRLKTFSIQPRPDGLDSAKFAVDAFGFNPPPVVVVYATMAADGTASDTVCNVHGCSPSLLINLTTSDSNIATIDQNGTIGSSSAHEQIPGHVAIVASTYAYGVGVRDSLPFVIGWPIVGAKITVERTTSPSGVTSLYFHPSSITIGVGGFVHITSHDSTAIDVVFDPVQKSSLLIQNDWTGETDSTTSIYPIFYSYNPDSLPTGSIGEADRTWAVYVNKAGVYNYQSKLFGTKGTIVVSSGP